MGFVIRFVFVAQEVGVQKTRGGEAESRRDTNIQNFGTVLRLFENDRTEMRASWRMAAAWLASSACWSHPPTMKERTTKEFACQSAAGTPWAAL